MLFRDLYYTTVYDEKTKITNHYLSLNQKKLQNWVHGNHGPLDIPDVGSGAEEV